MCMCMYKYISVVCAHVCPRGDEKGMKGDMLHHSPSYALETESLTEPLPTWLGYLQPSPVFLHRVNRGDFNSGPQACTTSTPCPESPPVPQILLIPASVEREDRVGALGAPLACGEAATSFHPILTFNRGKLSHKEQMFT